MSIVCKLRGCTFVAIGGAGGNENGHCCRLERCARCGDPWPVSDVGGVDTVGTQPRNRASASPHWGSCGSWLPSTAARRVAMILRAMTRLVMSVRGSPALYGPRGASDSAAASNCLAVRSPPIVTMRPSWKAQRCGTPLTGSASFALSPANAPA